MATLTDLGFCQNIICETILCTFNPNGSPNAAPMGATIKNSNQVTLTIYNSADTLQNLQNTHSATLNLTGNIDFYYRSAFKEEPLPLEWFEKTSTVNAPKLKTADAVVSLKTTDFLAVDDKRTKVTCEAVEVEASMVYPQVYCRALPAMVEAIIHATRVKALSGVKQETQNVAKLVSLIQDCSEVVNRSAPGSRYVELMADLKKKVDSWRLLT